MVVDNRYGTLAGYALSNDGGTTPANGTCNAGQTKTVAGATIYIPADINFIALNPFMSAAATATGLALDFRFTGQMVTGATWNTNYQVVRCIADAKGLNKGPIDHLAVKGLRRLKLTGLSNNAGTAMTVVNVEYRLMR
jgi:hypothetical protein